MYDLLEMGNICNSAYKFNLVTNESLLREKSTSETKATQQSFWPRIKVYLGINYLSLFLVLCVLLVLLYAEHLRRTTSPVNQGSHDNQLVGTYCTLMFANPDPFP